jgi:hypothetical protein
MLLLFALIFFTPVLSTLISPLEKDLIRFIAT